MKILDCKQFKEMVLSGANNLSNNAEKVNKLNVFPVPDGDTGTNMNMTFSAAAEEASKFMNDYIGDTAKLLSRNMLMNARGNSGVILSQVFKGIAKELAGVQSADVQQLSNAFVNGSRVAYKAIMKPVEGTILTVVRESAEIGEYHVKKNPNISIEDYMACMLQEAEESLQRTPELLNVLKEANVVDSGGSGYVCILQGFNAYLQGKPVTKANEQAESNDEAEKGYCCEFIVALNEQYKKEFVVTRLEKSLGRSCDHIKIAREEDKVKLHVHTLRPGDLINILQRFGEFDLSKVERLQNGHNEILTFEKKEEARKECALIAVCNAEGMAERFKELSVDYIVFGGQTMNPSTQDFMSAIREANAKNTIILPNNGNIILAAKQAKEMCNSSNVIVIESKTIMEGINACINYSTENDLDSNVKAMQQSIKDIRTIQLTQAIKNTSYNGMKIRKNNYIGMLGKEIVATGRDMMKTLKATIDLCAKEDISYLTVIYGKEVSRGDAQAVLDYAAEKYDAEGEIINGKQELYPFVIGVE